MKNLSEDEKLIKGLRSYFKSGIFAPVFFSIGYIFTCFGLIINPDISIWKKVVLIGFLLVIIIVFWLFYIKGKRNERKMKPSLDELEASFAKQKQDISDTLFDEIHEENSDENYSEEQMNEIQVKTNLFFRSQIHLILTGVGLSIALFLYNLLHFPIWLSILIFSLIGLDFVIWTVLYVKRYRDLKEYVNSVSKEKI